VLDKAPKLPSKASTNLYCTIENIEGTIVKSKLILLEKGTGFGTFKLDSLFASGEYRFKAYTNWMRNFKEQNFYVQTIQVIDPEATKKEEVSSIEAQIDYQLLPEGGHLISEAKNTIGVIAKNAWGLGISDLEGAILNDKDDILTTFKTSAFGLAKFTFEAKKNRSLQLWI